MEFKIKEITDKEVWEDFLLGCEEKTFLQSWNWGEFQKMIGNKIWRLGVYDNEQLIGAVLVLKIQAKRATFLLIQHGPNVRLKIKDSRFKILTALLEKLKMLAKEEKASFIRMVPLFDRNEENKKIFRDLGFREAPMHASAYEATLKLDITLPEEDLLKNMRKTTRYLIRQAQKDKNIEIFQRWHINDVETFNKIHQEVVKAQKFVPFSLQYFENEFSVFNKDNQVSIFFGRYKNPRRFAPQNLDSSPCSEIRTPRRFAPQNLDSSGIKGKIVASAFVIFWSNIGFYHHAALLPQYHKIPISYLLQWEAIKEAKKRNCFLYDFWGFVDPKKYPKHPWAGPTLFKMGFGGKPFEYLKTQDFVLSKKYWLNYLVERLRKFKRNL